MLEDEKKKTAAATEIEYRERLGAMQFQVLRAHDVEAQPSFHIGVFGVVQPRRGMRRLDVGQPRLIDLRVERLERNRMNDALRPAPGPAIGERLRELRDFVGKPHDSNSQMKMPPRVSQKRTRQSPALGKPSGGWNSERKKLMMRANALAYRPRRWPPSRRPPP